MIYNRTISDVEKARELRKSKVQKGIALSDSEKDTMERGTLTVNTLNRIEEKYCMIFDELCEMGYYSKAKTNDVEWTEDKLLNASNYERICSNSAYLIDAYYVFPSTPAPPLPTYHYETLNAIEKIIVDLESMITSMKQYYTECGTIECGA